MTYRDEPEPTLSPGEVLIRVDAVGICGSDMHAYHGRDPRRVPPLILGHELAGEILAGPGAGRRVTVNPADHLRPLRILRPGPKQSLFQPDDDRHDACRCFRTIRDHRGDERDRSATRHGSARGGFDRAGGDGAACARQGDARPGAAASGMHGARHRRGRDRAARVAAAQGATAVATSAWPRRIRCGARRRSVLAASLRYDPALAEGPGRRQHRSRHRRRRGRDDPAIRVDRGQARRRRHAYRACGLGFGNRHAQAHARRDLPDRQLHLFDRRPARRRDRAS